MLSTGKTITIFGGTGFVGRYLVSNLIDLGMVEMIPEYLDVIEGKIGRINEIYLMRQHGNNNSHHAQFVEKHGSILNRLAFGDFSHDLKIWANILSKELAQKDNISIKNFTFI